MPEAIPQATNEIRGLRDSYVLENEIEVTEQSTISFFFPGIHHKPSAFEDLLNAHTEKDQKLLIMRPGLDKNSEPYSDIEKWSEMDLVAQGLFSIIDTAEKYKISKFVLGGHSLGGFVASKITEILTVLKNNNFDLEITKQTYPDLADFFSNDLFTSKLEIVKKIEITKLALIAPVPAGMSPWHFMKRIVKNPLSGLEVLKPIINPQWLENKNEENNSKKHKKVVTAVFSQFFTKNKKSNKVKAELLLEHLFIDDAKTALKNIVLQKNPINTEILKHSNTKILLVVGKKDKIFPGQKRDAIKLGAERIVVPLAHNILHDTSDSYSHEKITAVLINWTKTGFIPKDINIKES